MLIPRKVARSKPIKRAKRKPAIDYAARDFDFIRARHANVRTWANLRQWMKEHSK